MLARKTRQLSGLFKAKQDKKVADFLLRDFDTDESARASACKNAYSLLAKHQVLGALAFFVLARRIDDALHLLLHNLEEMHLAVVLVRLAAASPQEETALLHSLLTDTVIPFAEARGDRGLLHLCLWRLSRPAAAAAALWIRDPSCAHLTAVEGQVASSSRTPGLLSRLTAATDQETTGSSNAVGEPVGSRVHPATLALLETMTSRYRHLHGMWLPVPREALCIAVVRALLADGCAALAAPVLAPLRRGGDGALSERAASADALDALCISVCLAKAAELIRAEGSRHACTGENQVDLSRFIRLLRGIVDALDVDLAAVSPLLVRFALSRGFWRLGHALVTDEWHGSCSSRDSALASVALHPFTCAMAGSISHLVAHTVAQQVLEMAVLPDSLWSTAERKGKCLQLILHGLTVANDGNTGALAVLAAQLGVPEIRAIDIAAAAVESTRHNMVLNRVEGSIEVDTTPLDQITDTFDIVMANILAPVLMSMADDLRRVLRPGGSLVISGILADRHDHVLEALRPLAPVRSLRHHGWISIVLR